MSMWIDSGGPLDLLQARKESFLSAIAQTEKEAQTLRSRADEASSAAAKYRQQVAELDKAIALLSAKAESKAA